MERELFQNAYFIRKYYKILRYPIKYDVYSKDIPSKKEHLRHFL